MEQAQAIWAATPELIQQAIIGLVMACIAWATQEVRKRTAVREQAVIGAVAEIEAASNPRVIMSSASKKSAAIAHALERMPAKARVAPEKVADIVERVLPSVVPDPQRVPSVPPPKL